MGLFSSPKVAKPEPPKPAPPAPAIDATALASRNKADKVKDRFGIGDTTLALGRPRTPGSSTMLGRAGYSQAA
jgi:hypothetical protein